VILIIKRIICFFRGHRQRQYIITIEVPGGDFGYTGCPYCKGRIK